MSDKSTQIFNLPQYTQRRQDLRANQTEPEKRLWQIVRGKQLGVKFRRQHGIGHYIVDFYCPEKSLVIEVDGDSHFNELGKNHDAQRDACMRNLGLSVLRFTNVEVMQNLQGVVEHILAWLAKSDPTPTLPLSGEGVTAHSAPSQGKPPKETDFSPNKRETSKESSSSPNKRETLKESSSSPNKRETLKESSSSPNKRETSKESSSSPNKREILKESSSSPCQGGGWEGVESAENNDKELGYGA